MTLRPATTLLPALTLAAALSACTQSPAPATVETVEVPAPAAEPVDANVDTPISATAESADARTSSGPSETPATLPAATIDADGFTIMDASAPQGDVQAPQAEEGVVAAAGDADLAADSLLRAHVLLERAHFSPGEIDGETGSNTRRAISGFQKANGLTDSGELDAATWEALNRDSAPILIDYTITEDDLEGPFAPTPARTMDMAERDALPYESVEEKLGEKFHASPTLLATLNPDADFKTAGTRITVPNVAAAKRMPRPTSIRVSKSRSVLELLDAEDKVLGQYPVTTGSAQFPLPIGEWKVTNVARDPVWHFDPSLIANTRAGDRKAEIPPGPNNPVGSTWIGISKPHYGIHGTPNPRNIAKSASNGCIRMTNWAAAALAGVVGRDMAVSLVD
ncbi:MAG: L,D-transpeptidase family protein [Pseudoxanthomonas suwonensis]|nr:L,D-transpeptidase family protein [Pseudoxanthomonas suwonensis]